MILLIGEGKYDAIFFSFIIKNINPSLKLVVEYDSLEKMTKKITQPNFLSGQKVIFIYGNNGSNNILIESLYLMRSTFSLRETTHKMCVIRDDDGGKKDQILKNYSKQIADFISKKNFSKVPHYELEENILKVMGRNKDILIDFNFIQYSFEYYLYNSILKPEGYVQTENLNFHDLIKNYLKDMDLNIDTFIENAFSRVKNEAWVKLIEKSFISLLN